MTQRELQVVELALRSYLGTLDECLEDEALSADERASFLSDQEVVLRLLAE